MGISWGYMPEIEEAQEVLAALGLPAAQQNDIAALTLLALCGLKPGDPWSAAQRRSLTVTKGIMTFIREVYGRAYAPNTRETFRRQVLHVFVQARVVDYNPDQPNLPTNSPKAHYAMSKDALAVVRTFRSSEWQDAVVAFVAANARSGSVFTGARLTYAVSVTLPDGSNLLLSPGEHNRLQAQVMELFMPRFAANALVLYFGDTADKNLYIATEQLTELGIPITQHDKLPDIILYHPDKQWLYLIEVVTSHGPMTPKRLVELNAMLRACSSNKVFITAFPTFAEYRRHMRNIAWDTDIWIAEAPDHMIHYNGDRFLAPR